MLTTCVAWWALRRTAKLVSLRTIFPRIIFSLSRFFEYSNYFSLKLNKLRKSGWKLTINCSQAHQLRSSSQGSSSYASRDNSWKLFAEAHQAEASHVAKRSVYFRRTDVNIYQLDKNRKRGGSSFCFVKPPPWFSALVLYWRLPKTGTHLRSVIKENNGGVKRPPPLDKVIVSWR